MLARPIFQSLSRVPEASTVPQFPLLKGAYHNDILTQERPLCLSDDRQTSINLSLSYDTSITALERTSLLSLHWIGRRYEYPIHHHHVVYSFEICFWELATRFLYQSFSRARYLTITTRASVAPRTSSFHRTWVPIGRTITYISSATFIHDLLYTCQRAHLSHSPDMVLQPLYALWQAIKATKPAFLRKKPHFSFITVHCAYIIARSLTIDTIS